MKPRRRATRRGLALRDALIGGAALIVLAIIGVVTLTGGGVRAAETQSLANLRQIGEGFASYSAFSAGRFPYAEAGESIRLGPQENAPTVTIGPGGAPVWTLETLWFALVPVGETWQAGAEIVRSPGGDALATPLDGRPGAWGTTASVSYHFSNSFVADPGAWPAPADDGAPDAADSDRTDLFRATLVAEVATPSRKVVLLDADRFYLPDEPGPEAGRPVAFVDNSAFVRRDDAALAPVRCRAARGEGAWRWPSMRVFHDTALGAKGREF